MGTSLLKWAKYKVLRGSGAVVSALPNTAPMSGRTFWSFLARYGTVIVKPSNGEGGVRVIQVASLGGGKYEVHYGRMRRRFASKAAVYSFVCALTRKGIFIVQQKIPLARVGGRPFDLRVMVQRGGGGSWAITGKLAKIAGAGFMITNTARSRGRVAPVTAALRSAGFTAPRIRSIQAKIDRVSVASAKRLRQRYPFLRTVGMDIGVDHRGKVWIIETNFAPAKSLFLRLKDKTMYRRIISYSKVRLRKPRRK
ncbi:YheC/YheD family protein [Paenibacillus thermotolerans]|uniref:YheC/YheD family protein n=1 Tax=Paenibacillus thermotolerans TaxID=3027807 RepID=UPI0023689666|nr:MULTISPECIES: YheC/YheD family protein [unclassified Paenibacillus]